MIDLQRVRCAAAGLFRDKHQCVGTWWIVTSPSGEIYDLCSGACLVEFACLGAQPADVDVHQDVGIGYVECGLLSAPGRSVSR
jgi:hypothetical protein